MISLPNGCSCSNLSVYPKDWQSKNAKIAKDWYIMYRFYDPKYSKPKQIMLKGMNQFKNLQARQIATKRILCKEMDKLIKESYNPFLKEQLSISQPGVLSSKTPILEALMIVYEKVNVSNITKKDLKFMLSLVTKAIKALGLQDFEISRVSKKTIKMILETASNSSDRFNKNVSSPIFRATQN